MDRKEGNGQKGRECIEKKGRNKKEEYTERMGINRQGGHKQKGRE
jgi:hypothetical protein